MNDEYSSLRYIALDQKSHKGLKKGKLLKKGLKIGEKNTQKKENVTKKSAQKREFTKKIPHTGDTNSLDRCG